MSLQNAQISGCLLTSRFRHGMWNITANEDEMAEGSMKDSGRATKGMDGGRAATGPGATGKLPGATESARQEP